MPEVEEYDQDRVGDINEKLVREFRANGGKVTGVFAGMPLLLSTTIGARSGQARTAPLVYTKDGEAFRDHRVEGRRSPPSWVVPQPGGQSQRHG